MPASEAVARVSACRERCTIDVRGVVQGIGFRPLVYRLAVRHALGGAVRNSRQGVTVEVEGESAALRAFLDDLAAAVPDRGDRALRVTRGEPCCRRHRTSPRAPSASRRWTTPERGGTRTR